jgi:hypothetical protein
MKEDEVKLNNDDFKEPTINSQIDLQLYRNKL